MSEILINENYIDEQDKKPNFPVYGESLQSSANPRFWSLTKQNVDEIASKSVQQRTHKQTNWGIKVFKGKNYFYL